MKKVFLLLSFFMSSFAIFAQGVDEVTLVVSGEAATKNDATTAALRSAIEQAYGVFVSANTEILNDELVKDEIVTVSSGNVKSYKELGCVMTADSSLYMVSLEAVVSVKQLTQYAASKGSSCEFAGATLNQNLKLLELNAKNTSIAFDNMMKQLEAIAPTIYDYELLTSEPRMSGSDNMELGVTVRVLFNRNFYEFCNVLLSTLSSLNVTEELVSGYEIYKYRHINSFSGGYSNYTTNKYGTSNSYKFLAPFPVGRFNDLCYEAYCNFVVFDNNGKYYQPNLVKFDKYIDYDADKGYASYPRILVRLDDNRHIYTPTDTGIIFWIPSESKMRDMLKTYEQQLNAENAAPAENKKNKLGEKLKEKVGGFMAGPDGNLIYSVDFIAGYSREEINALTGFTVERKTTEFSLSDNLTDSSSDNFEGTDLSETLTRMYKEEPYDITDFEDYMVFAVPLDPAKYGNNMENMKKEAIQKAARNMQVNMGYSIVPSYLEHLTNFLDDNGMRVFIMLYNVD